MACKYEYNGSWYTKEELSKHDDFNVHGSPYSSSPIGVSPYKKFAEFKEQLAAILWSKLNRVNRELSGQRTVDERRNLLSIKSDLELRLNGDVKRGIKGIMAEIKELEGDNLTKPLSFYVEQDLLRLGDLSKSQNVGDIKEAQEIIDFYDDAGSFIKGGNNPFFTDKEIFVYSNEKATNTFALPQNIITQYRDWRDKAIAYQTLINIKEEEAVEKIVNDSTTVKNISGRKLTYDTIVAKDSGIEDIDLVSMWLMDTTQTLSGGNPVLSQAMHSHLYNQIELKAKWFRDVETNLNAMHSDVVKELSNIDGGKHKIANIGILGIKGVSYNLFMQKSKTGRSTGKLISLESEDYKNKISSAISTFFEAMGRVGSIASKLHRERAFDAAYNTLLNTKRETSIIFDLSKIPEISGDIAYKSLAKLFKDDGGVHKNEMIRLLGQKEYDAYVAQQKNLLNNYIAERENILSEVLHTSGVSKYEDLADAEKFFFELRDSSINPFIGVKSFYSASQLMLDKEMIHNSGKYNSYVPRKYKATATVSGNDIVFTDTPNETGYHNTDFSKIRNNKALSDFYDIAKNVTDNIRDHMPPELQRKMAAGSIPMHRKAISEAMIDERGSILAKLISGFKKLLEQFKLSWGTVKEGDTSDAILNRKTGKPNYRINTSFLETNTADINRAIRLAEIDFLQKFGKELDITQMSDSTTIDLNTLSPQAAAEIVTLLGITVDSNALLRKDYSAIKNITGNRVQIKSIIRDNATHNAVQAYSFDLPKMLKLYASLTMAYSAREESLPILEIAKKHLDGIKAPMLNNTKGWKTNVFSKTTQTSGYRDNAIAQQEDAFNTVVLHNYDGTKSRQLTNKVLYTKEEKQLREHINNLIKNENAKGANTDPKVIKELTGMLNRMGKIITPSSIVDRLLKHIRFLGLGWNVPSAFINNVEGFISNMIQSASNEFYDGKYIFEAYKVTRWSRLKSLPLVGYESDLAHKNSTLMSRFNVLMDSKNELQKSSVKTNFSALEKLNPYYINSSVEFLNQSPIMIAMLMTQRIKDKNGNESSVWNAMDKNGNLIGDFRTDENIKNWEELTGQEYLDFKQKMSEAIVKAHGNYSDLRSMKIKNNLLGKIVMTFKTWLTSQIYSRYATAQVNLKSGSIQKGRFRSFTKATGGLYGAGVGLVVGGLPGFIAGYAIGSLAGSSKYGAYADVGYLKQLKESSLMLIRKMVGMPLNIIAGREVLSAGKNIDGWVKPSSKFTQVDANNLRANITEMALILNTFLMYIVVKSVFEDDDKRKNFLINKITQVIGQSTMYVRPNAFFKDMVGNVAIIRWLDKVSDVNEAIVKWLDGDDVLQNGDYRGESRLFRTLPKPFLPSILTSPLSIGFESSSLRVFDDLPWAEKFKDPEKQEKEDINRERARLQKELEDSGYDNKKQNRRILDERYPTQSRLKKLEMSREDYESEYGSSYELPEYEVAEEDTEE